MVMDGGIIDKINHDCNMLKGGEEKKEIVRQVSEELYNQMQEIVTKNGCKLRWDKEKNIITIFKEPKISEEDLAEFGLEGFTTDSSEVAEEKRNAEMLLALTNYRKEFFDNMIGILKGIDEHKITGKEIIKKLEISYKSLKVLNENNKKVWRGEGKYEDIVMGIQVIESLYGKNRKISELLEKIKEELEKMKNNEEIRVG